MIRISPLTRPLTGACLAAVALALAAPARADEAPTVTPYRPSVSTPAALSAPGWLELELGVQHSLGTDPRRRDSLPYTLKLAFSPDWGLRLGGEAAVDQRGGEGLRVHGAGDTSVVLKRRFGVDEASAFGLELGVKLPTARNGLGSGRADQSLNGIYSRDFTDAWLADLNLSATRLGVVGPGQARMQYGWAASVSRNLDEHWGLGAELSGTRQQGNAATAQTLFAASYALSRTASLDFGVSRGLNRASGDWSVFSGLTLLGARLF